MLAFQQVLESCTVTEFLTTYLATKCLHVPGALGKYHSLLSWADLNRLFSCGSITPQHLRFVKGGEDIPIQGYCVLGPTNPGAPGLTPLMLSFARVTHLLRDEATMIVSSIDTLHRPIADLCRSLEKILLVHVQANMYAVCGTSHGFDLHCDDHDVLVLQLLGRKHWQVYRPGPSLPLPGEHAFRKVRPAESPVWEGTLQDGHTLYMPRGWWHAAQPSGEPTIHLSISFRNLTGADLLTWMATRLASHEEARRDVPRFVDGRRLSEYVGTLQRLTTEQWCDPCKAAEDFLRHARATAKIRPLYGLPWTAFPDPVPDTADLIVQIVDPRCLEFLPAEQEGTIEVGFDSRAFRFGETTLVLFRFLLENGPVSTEIFYAQFTDAFGRDDLRHFLTELVRHGIAVVSEKSVSLN